MWICKQPGYVRKNCKARIIAHPEQVGEKESSTDNGSGQRACCALAALVLRYVYEEWFGDTDAPFHLTDYLRYMKNVAPLVGRCATGIGGMTCDVSSKRNEYVEEFKVVLVSANTGYKLFLSNAKFD